MRVALTGASGFLGWHVRVLARTRGVEVVTVPRDTLADPTAAASVISGCDRLLHVAGVNRGEPAEVARANVELGEQVAAALAQCDQAPAVVALADSVQAGNGTAYGDAKAEAASLVAHACASVGAGCADLLLPNLFGEHGRPHYNSVVATFCHELAEGREPVVHDADASLALLHVQAAAALLLDSVAARSPVAVPGTRVTVGDLARTLGEFSATYRRGDIPALSDELCVDLFNTYRAAAFRQSTPIPLQRHADHRGGLVEAVRVVEGGGQCFFSSSRPEVTRGEHYHLRKVERFVVLRGQATISLRRLLHDEVVTFRVSGDEPVAVDMPTMWAHNITNVGDDELLTLFWADQLFDPAAPDTYPEPVGDV